MNRKIDEWSFHGNTAYGYGNLTIGLRMRSEDKLQNTAHRKGIMSSCNSYFNVSVHIRKIEIYNITNSAKCFSHYCIVQIQTLNLSIDKSHFILFN